MELTGISPQMKAEKIQAKKPEDNPVARGEKTASTATDRVILSSGSHDIRKMQEILEQTPAVRTDRVQALKEQIARGEYQIDPEKLAGKMMSSLLSDSLG